MIGQTLSHYRILEKIGEGGMGVVYRAHDERLERDVALKVLPAGVLADEAARRRFRKEALALSRLNHPNIQTVHDFDTQDGVDFLVTEYVAGTTLSERMVAGALPETAVLQCAAQMADGLAAAHEQSIVHRDLKPANIRITPEGRVKILDFGLALLMAPPGSEVTLETLGQTSSGVGTLPYMAPEQLRNEQLDARSDLYALGALLYEMATGQRPFPQQQAPALITAILHQAPQPPREVHSKVSPALEQIILKALEKDREHRYQTARDLLADLRRLSAASSSGVVISAPPGAARPGRSPLAIGLGLVLVLAGAVLIWQREARLRQPPAPSPVAPAATSGPAAPSRPTLAVLPFRALSGQADDSQLGLGLTDAIVTGLGGSQDLTVRPTRAVLAYQEKLTDPVEAGKTLQVGAVLDGTLQKSGKRLRITVQLWQVSDGASLWSQKYDVQGGDVFAVQDEIGSKVAQALRIQLTAAARQRLSASHAKDPEVYALLLRARSLALGMSREGLQLAMPIYEDVLRKEPNNALAHALLARATQLFNFFYAPNNPAWLQRADSHARRALELDANLAEAYAAQAGIAWSPQSNFQHDRAISLYRKALELNPNLATDRAFLGTVYSHVGLLERAVEEHRRALEIDPKNLRALTALAEDYFQMGQPQRGEEVSRSALAIDPDYPIAR